MSNLDTSTKLIVLDRIESQRHLMPVVDASPDADGYITTLIREERMRLRRDRCVLAWRYGTSELMLNGLPISKRNARGLLAAFTVHHLGSMPWDILFPSRQAALNVLGRAADKAEPFSKALATSIRLVGTTSTDLVLRRPACIVTRIDGAPVPHHIGPTLLGAE